jgi:hypothetical protein
VVGFRINVLKYPIEEFRAMGLEEFEFPRDQGVLG